MRAGLVIWSVSPESYTSISGNSICKPRFLQARYTTKPLSWLQSTTHSITEHDSSITEHDSSITEHDSFDYGANYQAICKEFVSKGEMLRNLEIFLLANEERLQKVYKEATFLSSSSNLCPWKRPVKVSILCCKQQVPKRSGILCPCGLDCEQLLSFKQQLSSWAPF